MKWIKWSRYSDSAVVETGEMPPKDLPAILKSYGEQARELLVKNGADHVVYAVIEYTPESEMKEVQFYMLELDDKTFQERVNLITDSVVYAVHKR